MGIMAATVAPQAITVVTSDGNTMTVTSESHRNYDDIREAIKVRDYDKAQALIDLASEMAAKFASVAGVVAIKHGVLYFGDRPVGGVLGQRAVQMHSEGFDMAPMFAFVENLYQNPSRRAVQELYGFLQATDLPITEDGHFLAYKMVRDDYKSHHDGRTDNSIGAIVEMDRNEVDEDSDRTCSYGLHFCSQGYLGFYGYGGKTVICKINPRDVVSIPTDYNNAKGRACRYEIVGEFKDRPDQTHKWERSVADENMIRTGQAAPKPEPKVTTTDGKYQDAAGRWRDSWGCYTSPPTAPAASSGPLRDSRGRFVGNRPHEVSGGIVVYKDDLFLEDDVVFKKAVAEYVDLDIDTVVDACDKGAVKTVTNSNGHKLIVWEYDTEDKLFDFDEEQNGGW